MDLIAKNTSEIINKNGKTQDIANTVLSVYEESYQQVNELAQTFKADTVYQTGKNIFDYVIKNVNYLEDPFGVQWVKTPARLLADKSGDCKSMAIFISSCLRCLDIDHVFRFVSFNKVKEATHVYAVAYDENGDEIIIDPVVRPIEYNKEAKYTYHVDMSGTQIYKLAGIAGNDTASITVDFGETNQVTPELMSLYARRDLLQELITITTDSYELEKLVQELATQNELISSYLENNSDAVGSSPLDLLSAQSMADKMKSSGLYYLYLFIPDSQIANFPASIKNKRITQLKTFSFAEEADIWHNTGACMDLARSGIIARTGMQPEDFINSLRTTNYDISGIGSVTAIIGIISTVISLIALLKQLFGSTIQRNAPSNDEIKAGLPQNSDFSSKIINAVTANILPIAGLVTGMILLFKNKKK